MNVRSLAPLGAAREREHGQVLVLFALVLISLLLISALAVDYGGYLLARRSYQNIADQAALAGSYELTSPTGADCPVAVGTSKQQCARKAAWKSITDHLGIPAADINVDTVSATAAASLAVPWHDYTIWVASPPSDAGSAYQGFASSNKTVYVRVDRHVAAGLSRIVSSGQNVGAWATAGRIPENFAIILLCQSGCLGGNADGQVAGTGSNLILESGDLGSNSWVKTSGSSASLALCEGSAIASQCSAYMHDPSQCTTTSSVCQVDRWDGTSVDTSTRYSALALPQVVDPKYTVPTLSDTTNRTTGVVGGTAPAQCYSVLDNAAPAVSMAQPANGLATVNDPWGLVAAQLPPTPGPVALAANVSVAGKVTGTAGAGGGNLSGILVTLTQGASSYSDTSKGSGAYSIANVPTSATPYTLTATDATGVYHAYTQSVTVSAAIANLNFSMDKNPVITGTVFDNSSNPVAGATVTGTISGAGGGTWTATTAANGTYSLTVQPGASLAGPFSIDLQASKGGYTSSSTVNVSRAVNTTLANQNFVITPQPGSIGGTVTSGGSPVQGVTVTWSLGSTTSGSSDVAGNYTITGANNGSGVVTASKVGYVTATSNQTLSPGQTLTGVNFSLTAANSTINGHVYDQTTGLALPGVAVSASNGVSSGSDTTQTDGSYSITGLTPSNPKYTLTATITGWTTKTLNNQTVANGLNTIDFAATAGNALWPANCGTNGANKGTWSCDQSGGTGCTGVTNPSGIDVGCSSYSDANRIRPGTYKSITIGNNECAWIDPLGGRPGLTSGQDAGIIYVTDTLSIGSGAFLLGDGVTIVMATGAHADVGNSGGFVINYGGANCDPVPGSSTSCAWRTSAFIGRNAGVGTGYSACPSDSVGFADLRRGAFTTGGTAQVARLTWDNSTTPPCYQDGSEGPYLTANKGEIGIAWYLRGSPTCCGGHRFAFSGQMGFLFDGVLYGPNDDIDLGGQGAQAAAGQIVAYTLKYHGDTDIHQRYSGIEIDGPPYLIEPYIGE